MPVFHGRAIHKLNRTLLHEFKAYIGAGLGHLDSQVRVDLLKVRGDECSRGTEHRGRGQVVDLVVQRGYEPVR